MHMHAWHDPRMAIIYDVELPVPIYYFAPVNEEIERAYIQKSSEKLSYNLHTDKRWEETLPNLNPRLGEIEVSWAIQKVAEGLVSGVVNRREDDMYVWHPDGLPVKELSKTLSEALYMIGELRRSDDEKQTKQRLLERSIKMGLSAMDNEQRQTRLTLCRQALVKAREYIALQKMDGQATSSDLLDEPILSVLETLLENDSARAAAATKEGYKLRF